MRKRAGSFWWQDGHILSLILWPLSRIYGAIAGRRMVNADGRPASVPVICVGNFTVGGTGKTPVAEALAKAAMAQGLKPGFVLRGYGAKVKQAVLVDPESHTYADVGDEALMLSRTAPVAVSPARVDAAELLEHEGVDFIIMDDGLQSGRLKPDFSVVVVDAKRGFGNGYCLPAGPLRAPLSAQFPKTDMVLVNGQGGKSDEVCRISRAAGVAVSYLSQKPADDALELRARRVIAYAGIGDPQKFFDTLHALGAEIIEAFPLADHAPMTVVLAGKLVACAASENAVLVTTAKDMARLSGVVNDDIAALRDSSEVLEITAIFQDETMPGHLVSSTLDAFQARV